MFRRLFGSNNDVPPVLDQPKAVSNDDSLLLDDEATVILTDKRQKKRLVAPQWRVGDTINNRYRVDEIYSGAMGKVYIVEHLGWHVRMAMKSPRQEVLVDREGLKRILQEANGWVSLGIHPNIAACYYVLSFSNVPHIFIEYVNGGTLDDWIKKGRLNDWRTALSIAIQFCNGMEYTHSKGIIHRDIKPQNILLSQEGLVKITDFGIMRSIRMSKAEDTSKFFSGDNDDATIGFRGTPNYASPEQLVDAHQVDQRTDIFSFGLCLWMMFCGKRPYTFNTMDAECPEPVSVNPDVFLPRNLVKLLKKVVALKCEERYAGFKELRDDLDRIHQKLFSVSCPYALLGKLDLTAENYNNRAVSLAELGKIKEAVFCLQLTLEINDTLPEAIHNLIMLNWRRSQMEPLRVLRQIESTQKRLPEFNLLDELVKEVREHVESREAGNKPESKRDRYPELKLCIPKSPLQVFREGQLLQSVRENILTLFSNEKYDDCFKTLNTAWANKSYRKDNVFNDIYEKLLKQGRKTELVAIQRVTTYFGPRGQANLHCYIPSLKIIIFAGSDGRVLFRSLSQKKNNQYSVLLEKRAPIRSMAVGPTDGNLAVGYADGAIIIRSLRARHEELIQTGVAVQTLHFAHSENLLFWGTADGKVTFRNLENKQQRIFSLEDGGAVRFVTLISNDFDFVTGSDDGSLRFWNIRENCPKRFIEAHVLPITALAVNHDFSRIATGSEDRMIRLWECSTGQCLQTIQAHDDVVASLLMLPDEDTLVSGCVDDIIKIWDLGDGSCRHILDGRGDGILSLCQGPKEHLFFTGGMDGAVVLWMAVYGLDFTHIPTPPGAESRSD